MGTYIPASIFQALHPVTRLMRSFILAIFVQTEAYQLFRHSNACKDPDRRLTTSERPTKDVSGSSPQSI